jgi:putative DNA primase/helicase
MDGNYTLDDLVQNNLMGKTKIQPIANSANLLIYEPEPLRAPLTKAAPYPVKALGDVLGSAATALHETIKAPLTLCCQSVLASAFPAIPNLKP